MKTFLHQVQPEHWAWIHAKGALFLWATLFLMFTPAKVEDVLGAVIAAFVALSVMVGVIISMVGMVYSFSPKRPIAQRGISMELFGLWMAFAGPIAYMAVQIFLAFGPNGIDRFALVALAYAMAALILVRIIVVLRYQKRGA